MHQLGIAITYMVPLLTTKNHLTNKVSLEQMLKIIANCQVKTKKFDE